jgi:predicted house-cleaning NTP pyrophosphatase (Maf/HAM1 superfamily)
MLTELSGQTFEAFTAVCVIRNKSDETYLEFGESTLITLRSLTNELIAAYLDSGLGLYCAKFVFLNSG